MNKSNFKEQPTDIKELVTEAQGQDFEAEQEPKVSIRPRSIRRVRSVLPLGKSLKVPSVRPLKKKS